MLPESFFAVGSTASDAAVASLVILVMAGMAKMYGQVQNLE